MNRSLESAYFVFGYTENDCAKGLPVSFEVCHSLRVAEAKFAKLQRYYGAQARGKTGNPQAGVLARPEIQKIQGVEAFYRFAKDYNFIINWEEKIISYCRVITLRLPVELMNSFEDKLGNKGVTDWLLKQIERKAKS